MERGNRDRPLFVSPETGTSFQVAQSLATSFAREIKYEHNPLCALSESLMVKLVHHPFAVLGSRRFRGIGEVREVGAG